MRRLLVIALCVSLLVCPMIARAEAPPPLSMADIDQMRDTGLSTMQDYVDALKPTGYTWYYEGEATGITYFTLDVPGGSVSLSVLDAPDYQDDDQGLDGATSLNADVLKKKATLSGVSWEGDALGFVFMPRELKLGDSRQKLLASIGELEMDSMIAPEGDDDADDDIEAEPFDDETDLGVSDEYDEFASCLLMVPDDPTQWHEYYGFDFFLKDGVIEMAQFWYSTDAE